MELRILGPIDVWTHGRWVRLSRQQRVVLAALLIRSGEVVTPGRLIELVWGDAAACGGTATLRSHIRSLRRALEPDRVPGAEPCVLVTGDSGYALRVRAEQVDKLQFEQRVEQGRQAMAGGDPGTAAERLRAALALWRGSPLSGITDRPFARCEAARLEELRQSAWRTRIEADLLTGQHHGVTSELCGLVTEHPADEGLRMLLALALYRCHRVAEAVTTCREGLELLQGLGIDSPALQKLQRDILSRSPQLYWIPAAPGRQSPPSPLQWLTERLVHAHP